MKIKYVSVENTLAEWRDKNSLLKRWEGLNKYTLNRWIAEMREHRELSVSS